MSDRIFKAQCKECHAECIVIRKDDIVSAEFNKLGIKCNAKFKELPTDDKQEVKEIEHIPDLIYNAPYLADI